MTSAWFEISDASGARRAEIRAGLTRVGGGAADVGLAGVGEDQLHIWDEPPRAVFVGKGAPPSRDGGPLLEAPLEEGARIEWGGSTLVFHVRRAAELEELPAAVAELERSPDERRAWERVHAGLLVDLGLADRKLVKRWQESVLARRFDADLCAREVLAGPGAGGADARVRDRAGTLLRDFLMAPLASGVRGASRKASRAAKGGIAFLLVQLLALLVYSSIVILAMVLLRWRGVEFDALLDKLLGR